MFGGENLSTIDGKGRTSIPAKFREMLGDVFGDECFVITKATPVDFGDGSYGRGLSVYPISEWRQLSNKILANEGGFTSVQLNSIKRQVLAPAVEVTADKLGRVLIPPALRVHAGLERDIWFVGMGRRFDVWSKEGYGRINAQDEKNFPQDSEALAALGI
jgi:MraZ protein